MKQEPNKKECKIGDTIKIEYEGKERNAVIIDIKDGNAIIEVESDVYKWDTENNRWIEPKQEPNKKNHECRLSYEDFCPICQKQEPTSEDKNIEDIISKFKHNFCEIYDGELELENPTNKEPKDIIDFLRLSLKEYGEVIENKYREKFSITMAKAEDAINREAKEQLKKELIKNAPEYKEVSPYEKDQCHINSKNIGFNECREQFLNIIKTL